jgi:hypothetical protein
LRTRSKEKKNGNIYFCIILNLYFLFIVLSLFAISANRFTRTTRITKFFNLCFVVNFMRLSQSLSEVNFSSKIMQSESFEITPKKWEKLIVQELDQGSVTLLAWEMIFFLLHTLFPTELHLNNAYYLSSACSNPTDVV